MDKFRRVEIKYLINDITYNKLLTKIDSYFKPDIYYKSKVLNIYFDNENDELINASIEKPFYKQKVRLRSYLVPNSNDKVFLEIKKKCYGIVSKRRIEFKYKDYLSYLNGTYNNNSINFKEIDYVFKKYNLKPRYFVGYDRVALVDKTNLDLRITFDSNLRSRCDELDLSLGDAGILYFNSPTYIVEIKTLGSLPSYLSKILSELKIYPTSFSKIGAIYMKEGIKNV